MQLLAYHAKAKLFRDMNGAAAKVFLVCAAHANGHNRNRFWISVDTMCRESGLKRRTVHNALALLTEKGLLMKCGNKTVGKADIPVRRVTLFADRVQQGVQIDAEEGCKLTTQGVQIDDTRGCTSLHTEGLQQEGIQKRQAGEGRARAHKPPARPLAPASMTNVAAAPAAAPAEENDFTTTMTVAQALETSGTPAGEAYGRASAAVDKCVQRGWLDNGRAVKKRSAFALKLARMLEASEYDVQRSCQSCDALLFDGDPCRHCADAPPAPDPASSDEPPARAASAPAPGGITGSYVAALKAALHERPADAPPAPDPAILKPSDRAMLNATKRKIAGESGGAGAVCARSASRPPIPGPAFNTEQASA